MDWFEGEIPNAIQLAKTKRALIVVYITGEDEKSKESDQLWESKDVLKLFSNTEAVALKLQANSDACKQFSAIYPVIVIPCTFLIGDNGVPLDVIACELRQDTFVTKLKEAILKHEASQLATPPTAAASPTQQTLSMGQDTGEIGAATGYTPTTQQMAEPIPSLSKEEKIQRAKDLIAEKQAKKLAEEKEKEKNQETERRDLGRSAAQLQQYKQETEMKEAKKQWQKDKEADRVARERVRAQIAMDRAEKSEAFQREKEAKEREKREKEEAKKAKLDEEAQASQALEDEKRSEFARIQFRLPDGSTVTNKFASSLTLSDADAFISQFRLPNGSTITHKFASSLTLSDAFISQHTGMAPGTLTLSTIYPRRTFTHDNLGDTLRELELTPSAVLMVTQSRRSATIPSNPLYSIVSFVMAPLSLMWNFIYGVLFGFSTPISPSQQSRNNSATTRGEDSPSTREDSEPTPSTSSGAGSNRPQTAVRRTPRTEGNTRRLHQLKDDDDENATWNGNSTQQL